MHQKRDQMEMGGGKRKTRIFAPVTLKMIFEAAPRPDDVLEIEGENIADVRHPFVDSVFRSSWWAVLSTALSSQ